MTRPQMKPENRVFRVCVTFRPDQRDVVSGLQNAVCFLGFFKTRKMNISNLEVRKMASAFVAAVLSFFVVGLGQVYNGQLLKGIFLLMLATLLVITTGPFLVWAVWLAGIIDAHRVASHKVTIEKSTLKAMKMVE